MTSWIESLNSLSNAWGPWLWRACWQGAVVIAAAWLLTLLLRGWSPRLRSWIWRITYLKLLLLLLWTGAIELPILPATGTGTQGVLGAQGTVESPRVATEQSTPPVQAPNDRLAALPAESPPTHTLALPITEPRQSQPAATRATLSWTTIAGIVWLLGAVAVLLTLVFDAIYVLRLASGARPIDDPELARLLDEVCRQLNLKARIGLRVSETARGPMLVRFTRPVILLPSKILASLDYDEIRLILAHELAHIKRRDLAWNALAAPVHILLYFHPLVWLAHRCARQEQEMACDELVITRLNIGRQAYGETLLKVIKQIDRGFRKTAMAAGASASNRILAGDCTP